jgi:hypothetical protein
VAEGLGVDQTSVFTDVQGEIRHEGAVGKERDKENRIRDDS